MINQFVLTGIAFSIFSTGLIVPAQEPTRVDVKAGPAAEAIHDELLKRSQNGLGCAIIAEKNGQVVLKAGYGWANRADRTPFSTTTIAQVGSLTKQFTAAAIVDLSLKRKLSFSDPIAKYLTDVPPPAASITIHQLLTHTAGLPENCGPDFDRLTRSEMVKRCLANAGAHPAKFSYSNLGYSVLAAIVERVTHKPLEDYLERIFFKPLKMKSTGYFFAPALVRRMALGYTSMGTNPPISETLKTMGDAYWNLKGNGGIQASADDMYLWYRALTHGPVVSETMRKILTTPQAARDNEVKYGYGWYIRTRPDGQVEQISHTGSDGVFLSVFVMRPAEKVFYYYVTNNRDKGGAELASLVIRILRET
jgi:CubicO group peptidase (beta-lactamase class C family)